MNSKQAATLRTAALAAAILGATGLTLTTLAAPALLAAQVSDTEIMYVALRNDRPWDLRRMDTSGNSTRLFSKCFAAGAHYCTFHDPVLSPDGRRVAMVVNHVNESGNNYSVWISSLSGSGARQVTTVVSPSGRPSWGRTKNGTELIVYERGNRIHQVDLCRDALPAAGRLVADGASPSIDPTGQWIVFARANDIWKIRTNGGGETRLVGTSLLEKDPRWSKTTLIEKIIFLRRMSTGWKLQIVDPDGSNVSQKTEDGGEMEDPDAASLPNAFTWEQDGAVYVKIGTNATTRLKTGARDPVFGQAPKRFSKTCP